SATEVVPPCVSSLEGNTYPRCVWASIKPGTTVRPDRSTTSPLVAPATRRERILSFSTTSSASCTGSAPVPSMMVAPENLIPIGWLLVFYGRRASRPPLDRLDRRGCLACLRASSAPPEAPRWSRSVPAALLARAIRASVFRECQEWSRDRRTLHRSLARTARPIHHWTCGAQALALPRVFAAQDGVRHAMSPSGAVDNRARPRWSQSHARRIRSSPRPAAGGGWRRG